MVPSPYGLDKTLNNNNKDRHVTRSAQEHTRQIQCTVQHVQKVFITEASSATSSRVQLHIVLLVATVAGTAPYIAITF